MGRVFVYYILVRVPMQRASWEECLYIIYQYVCQCRGPHGKSVCILYTSTCANAEGLMGRVFVYYILVRVPM